MAARRTDTRDRMIKSAARLLQRQGFVGTGMMQVVEEASASRGSVYFHFKGGKEELALEVLGLRRRELSTLVRRCHGSRVDAPLTVRRLARAFADGMSRSGFVEGCPVATIAVETAASHESLRQECDGYFVAWQSALARHFVHAGMSTTRAEAMATMTVSILEGALVLCRTSLSTAPLEIAAAELASLVGAELLAGETRKVRPRTRTRAA